MPTSKYPGKFLAVLVVLVALSLALAIAGEFGGWGWVSRLERVARGAGQLTFLSVGLTYIFVEAYEMLAAQFRKNQVAQGRAQGRSEALEEMRAWLDWKKRKADAEDAGKPFNEPEPRNPLT